MKYENDITAVKDLIKGDKEALKFFFEIYYTRLVAYVNTLCKDVYTAEDIVQQTFINLWESRQRLDPTLSPRNYLYSIARNRYIDTLKKNKKHSLLLKQLWELGLRDRIEEEHSHQEMRIAKLKDIIEELPPSCRKILKMSKMQGFSHKEISEKLQISTKTVESQMRIAYKKIRKAFEKSAMIVLTVLLRRTISFTRWPSRPRNI
ncbi:RNA polymerase sigma factor [Flagellimonas hymeniacidonis]|nr:RNA polymerase sigma-70 factor [Flagellimonas hymeniacidonis]